MCWREEGLQPIQFKVEEARDGEAKKMRSNILLGGGRGLGGIKLYETYRCMKLSQMDRSTGDYVMKTYY